MIPHRSSLPLTAATVAAILAGTALAADCTKVIRASGGDTCAILTQQHGISVTQFIAYNPTITTCTLSAGVSYCVSQNPADGPAISVPPGTLIPSPIGSDGVCGGEYTCLGSVYGDCCSQNGYCGNGTDYCSEGCNTGYGRCGEVVDEPGPGTGPGTVTVTVTLPPPTTSGTTLRPSTISTRTTTRSTTTRTTTTTTTTTSRAPSPTLSGTVKNCTKYHKIDWLDTCSRLARTYGVTTAQIQTWNPRFDCYDAPDYEGYHICVGVSGPSPPGPSTTKPPGLPPLIPCLLGILCLE